MGNKRPGFDESTLEGTALLAVLEECLIPLELTLLSKGHVPNKP